MTMDLEREYKLLRESAGVLDLNARSRLCLTGADRQRFLNGQVTNNVKDLQIGQGCYAALVNAKGKMQSDLYIYCLTDEILLDFEPGLTGVVTERLEKFVIADDVQIVDVAAQYGMLSVQGPKSASVIEGIGLSPPAALYSWQSRKDPDFGEIYCMDCPRCGSDGFDIFVPAERRNVLLERLCAAGGGRCSLDGFEIVRVEVGIPRFGLDMDETNLAPETGIEARAISYTKGCYIGQEVISRIRTYGQVAKALRGLWLPDRIESLPRKGEKLFHDGKEVGYLTSAVYSPGLRRNIALGYVRREHNAPGIELGWESGSGRLPVTVAALPFSAANLSK